MNAARERSGHIEFAHAARRLGPRRLWQRGAQHLQQAGDGRAALFAIGGKSLSYPWSTPRMVAPIETAVPKLRPH